MYDALSLQLSEKCKLEDHYIWLAIHLCPAKQYSCNVVGDALCSYAVLRIR